MIKKSTLVFSTITLFLAAFLLAGYIMLTPHVFGASTQVPGVTLHTVNPPAGTQDFYTFFSATTTNATSTTAASSQDPGFLRIGGAADVMFFFSRGDTKGTGNAGSSLFKVQVTPDGVNWFDYNELGQIINTPDANTFFTRVGSTTISAATSTLQYAMEDISYYGVRCITVRATDGEASCKAVANFGSSSL